MAKNTSPDEDFDWEKLENEQKKKKRKKKKPQDEISPEVRAEMARLTEEELAMPYPPQFIAEINLMRRSFSKEELDSVSEKESEKELEEKDENEE